jgi:hypothetical protein
MCAAGTLSTGAGKASMLGSMLFERIYESSMANHWERRLLLHSDQTRNAIMIATIDQTFALLSGDPLHRALAAVHNGGLISVSSMTQTSPRG